MQADCWGHEVRILDNQVRSTLRGRFGSLLRRPQEEEEEDEEEEEEDADSQLD
jgi:hypothetical protein